MPGSGDTAFDTSMPAGYTSLRQHGNLHELHHSELSSTPWSGAKACPGSRCHARRLDFSQGLAQLESEASSKALVHCIIKKIMSFLYHIRLYAYIKL